MIRPVLRTSIINKPFTLIASSQFISTRNQFLIKTNPRFMSTKQPDTLTKEQQDAFISSIHDNLSQAVPTKFYINSERDKIKLLFQPNDFYQSLLQNILAAKERVFLTSLYLGKHENEMIQTLDSALTKNPNLKVHFLLDGLRSTREFPHESSITLISSLIEKYGSDRIQFRLYRTPSYHGWKSHLIPKRFNEGLGLQHMKFYGFDNDKIILTGANLSDDYFTNRQDRYWYFQNSKLNSYYFQIMQLVGSLSYKVEMNNNLPSLVWPGNNITSDPLKNRTKFLQDSSSILNKFLHEKRIEDDKIKNWDTVIFPISQFTPLFKQSVDKSTELPTVLSLFQMMKNFNSTNKNNINWTFTAGYFNMFPTIRRAILNSYCSDSNVMTASSKANGFFQSKGVSRHLPDAYMHLSYKFLKQVEKSHSNISVKEWENGVFNKPNGWSYHAKGIWFYFGNTQERYTPFLTILGSSNFTRRSYSLDLESNIVILTKNKELQKELNNELDHLLKHTSKITLKDFKEDPERHVQPGVKIATKLLGRRL